MDSQGGLSATQGALLGLVRQRGPLNGNALARAAALLIGEFWTVTRSQVYRELDHLEKMGLVAAGPLGRRSSREYTVTRAGDRAFLAWLTEDPEDPVIRFAILLTVRFAADLDPRRLAEILRAHRERTQAKLLYYDALWETLSQEPDPFELATLRLGILIERAIHEWSEELPGLLPRGNH